MTKLADLPEDLRRYIAQADEGGDVPSESVLAAIGVQIGVLRDEAKRARISSGIEDTWRLCEDAYACVDDANRGEMKPGSRWSKPMATQGPVTTDESPEPNSHSTLYVALTRRYVDAGTAKLGEILLAPGAKSFSISATPVPDLINAKEDKRQVLLDHLPGSPPAMRAAQPGDIVPPAAPPAMGAPIPAPAGAPPAGAAGAPPAPPMVPVTPADLAKESLDLADKAAKKVEKRIYDWMVECRRSSQVRKVIFDSGRLGVGVLKGPFPKSSRAMATSKQPDGNVELKIVKKITPASKWVNAWNFFPDPSCGEDIQSGEHCFEREWMTERQVRGFKKLPGYMKAQIDKVILQGPQQVNATDGSDGPAENDRTKDQKGKYEVWYFTGTLSAKEMACICDVSGTDMKAMVKDGADQVYAIVTLINDCVVKATVNPLDSGEFNYHAMPWCRKAGSWAGVGIAEQIQTPQAMLNASVRSMLDNAGISAGGQIVIDTSLITPADGEMGMTPHKIWYLNGDSAVMDVNKAFGLFKVDNVTQEMMQIVELAMRLGEEATSIPLVTQGQSGPTTPDTFGAAQLQNNNANQLLRSIGYLFDDCITEPEVNQYYEWALLDPDVPNDEKGDYNIDAHGSSALVEQAVQTQFTMTLLPLSVNPAYRLDPAKVMAVVIEGNKINPIKLQYTDEEFAKLPPSPAPPQIEVAKINAAVKTQQIAADKEDDDKDREIEIALGAKHIGLEEQRIVHDTSISLQDLQVRRELAILGYASQHQISIEQVKAKLAGDAMKLQVQKELSANRVNGAGRRSPGAARPPTEPAGRASDGRAFEQ